MQQSDTTSTSTTGTLADRGVGWQATGFAVTGLASLAILKTFDGSEIWLYQWFETAAVDLYWAFLVPLAVLFDGGRRLFEKGKAIREAQKARMVEKARQKAKEEERQRIMRNSSDRRNFPPLVAEVVLQKRSEDVT